MKKITIIITGVFFILSSCTKNNNLPDIGGTKAQSIANEWWVTLDQGGAKDVAGLGYFKIATYNTAANNDSIWVDDFENGWQVKFKAAVNYNDLTFSTTAAQNEYYDMTVNLTEGKVLTGAGHSKAGNVTDSIHMKVEFSDDPGTIYEMNGTARTKLIEDEY